MIPEDQKEFPCAIDGDDRLTLESRVGGDLTVAIWYGEDEMGMVMLAPDTARALAEELEAFAASHLGPKELVSG